MKLMLILIVLAALSGCAVMDMSTLDTAVPIYPEIANANVYMSVGVDYSSGYFMTDAELTHVQEHDISYSGGLGMEYVWGARVGVAVNERFDLQGKYYEANNSLGAKIGIKALVHQDSLVYYALQPSVTLIKGRASGTLHGEPYENKFSAKGLELTGFISRVHGKHTIATAALRTNITQLDQDFFDKDFETKYIFHGGISGNMRWRISILFAGIEIGADLVPNHEPDLKLAPYGGLGLGIQF